MMDGYSKAIGAGVHSTCDLKTGKTCNTRHVKGMDMLCGEHVKQGGKAVDDVTVSDQSDDESSSKDEHKQQEEEEADGKEAEDLEGTVLEEMKEATEDADSEALLKME